MSEAAITAAAAQVGRIDQPGSGRVQLRHKGVEIAAGVGRLGRPCGRREIGGDRAARHVGAARVVHGDIEADINVAAAQVGRIDQPGSGRVQLRHKGVENAAVVGRLGRPCGRREIGRGGVARHVGAARAVHGDALAGFSAAAAEVRRIDQHGIDDQWPAADRRHPRESQPDASPSSHSGLPPPV